MKKIDRIGQRFERLVIISEVPKTYGKQRRWLCQCDCGNTTEAITQTLVEGRVKSCGCYGRELHNWIHIKSPEKEGYFDVFKIIKLLNKRNKYGIHLWIMECPKCKRHFETTKSNCMNLSVKGCGCSHKKLSNTDIEKIKMWHATDKFTMQQIAWAYKVDLSLISRIIKGTRRNNNATQITTRRKAQRNRLPGASSKAFK